LTPTADQFKAIGRLKSNHDFVMFKGWLEEELRQATEAVFHSGGEKVFRDQGRAQALSGLLQIIGSAATALPR
jgi:hypothetical protein